MTKLAPLVLLFMVVILCVAGCKSGESSPEATAQQYLDLMKKGDYEAAAKMWDYVTEARTQNEDWDNIQEGQRTLIVNKLAEEKAGVLKQWDGYFPSETKLGGVQESGDTATASLQGGRVLALKLVKMDDQWKIAGME
ncbi:MAG: nuclear transport factor 2 family protein [Armatimonadota bacterium]